MKNAEKLEAILDRIQIGGYSQVSEGYDRHDNKEIAERLDQSGVVVVPAMIGDVLYVINRRLNRIFECTVISVHVGHKNQRKNHIKTKWVGTNGNESIRKWALYQIGNYVFFDKESAEAALKQEPLPDQEEGDEDV